MTIVPDVLICRHGHQHTGDYRFHDWMHCNCDHDVPDAIVELEPGWMMCMECGETWRTEAAVNDDQDQGIRVWQSALRGGPDRVPTPFVQTDFEAVSWVSPLVVMRTPVEIARRAGYLTRCQTRYRLALAREDKAAAIVRRGDAHPDAWDELNAAAIWVDAWAQAIVHSGGTAPRESRA